MMFLKFSAEFEFLFWSYFSNVIEISNAIGLMNIIWLIHTIYPYLFMIINSVFFLTMLEN